MRNAWLRDYVRTFEAIERDYSHPSRFSWFRARPCPLCGQGTDQPVFLTVRGHHYLRCRRCSMVYVSRILTPEKLAEYYALPEHRAYFDNVVRERITEPAAPPRQYPGRNLAKRLLIAPYSCDVDRVRRLVPSGAILDVGCGAGDFLSQFADGYVRTGIEPNPDAAAHARRLGARVLVASLDDVPLEPAAYDAITMLQVIEHLADPAAAIRKLAAALRPRGVLYLNCPNVDSLSLRLFADRHIHLYPLVHVNLFARPTLTRLLADAGLSVVLAGSEQIDVSATDLLTWFAHRDRFVHRLSRQSLPPVVERVWNVATRLRPADWAMRQLDLGSYVFVAGKK